MQPAKDRSAAKVALSLRDQRRDRVLADDSRRTLIRTSRFQSRIGREFFTCRWLSVFRGVEILDREELGRSSRLVGGHRELRYWRNMVLKIRVDPTKHRSPANHTRGASVF